MDGPPRGARRLLARLTERGKDRPAQRPADIAFALDDRPPWNQSLALALQMLAIQSIYFLLPGIAAAAFGLPPLASAGYLCLTLLGLAAVSLLQALPHGPVGSGYAVPAIPSPVMVGAYLMAAESGTLGGMSLLLALGGALGLALALLLRRLDALLPTEVTGTVVFLIGVSLLPRAFAALTPAGQAPGPASLVAVAALALMVLLTVMRTRLARFGLLLGALAGVALCGLAGLHTVGAGQVLLDAPLLALPLPAPALPEAGWLHLLPAVAVAMLASFASWSGDLLAFQRAADGSWTRPDVPPLRRGLVAQSLGLVLAGGLGGMAPTTSSAAVGLAIATRALARRILVANALLLLLLACMPKVAALFVLVPGPVQAAMLAYVCCFMMASGCQLMATRLLDARRTFTIGLGLVAGLGVLIAPALFAEVLPRALDAPVTLGSLVAVGLNLLTAPLVARRAQFTLRAGPQLAQEVMDHCAALGGAWGTRRETMQQVGNALLELAELLAGRELTEMNLRARWEHDTVFLTIVFAGPPLPAPSARPNADDLTGPLAAQEAFAMWMATRAASRFSQRPEGNGTALRLEFRD